MKRILSALLITFLMTTSTMAAKALSISQRADIDTFISSMVKQHHFKRERLVHLFDKVHLQPKIVKAMQHPYEAMPWYKYRKEFLTPKRISGGIAYWKKHAAALKRAEKKYGVPAEMIVAIIGVETRYGKYQGHHRVIDALSTLAFDYPRRARFFQKELKHYLLLTREQNLDPLEARGSYAGAFGAPQFMPSSFRAYADKLDGKGPVDIIHNHSDAIASVANYFKKHGWQPGMPIAVHVLATKKGFNRAVRRASKPYLNVKELKKYGIKAQQKLTGAGKVGLIKLRTKRRAQLWLGYKNFYVIKRYNPSNLYAMAVYGLSQEIKKRRKHAQDKRTVKIIRQAHQSHHSLLPLHNRVSTR